MCVCLSLTVFAGAGLRRRPWTAKREGPGRVVLVAPALSDPCRSNCSAMGARCVALDAAPGRHGARGCVCADGVLLDYHNPTCKEGKYEMGHVYPFTFAVRWARY